MTKRAIAISAFVNYSGLFERLCMPFGLKNAPQFYQRLIYNTLYGYLKIVPEPNSSTTPSSTPNDVFADGVPDTKPRPDSWAGDHVSTTY